MRLIDVARDIYPYEREATALRRVQRTLGPADIPIDGPLSPEQERGIRAAVGFADAIRSGRYGSEPFMLYAHIYYAGVSARQGEVAIVRLAWPDGPMRLASSPDWAGCVGLITDHDVQEFIATVPPPHISQLLWVIHLYPDEA